MAHMLLGYWQQVGINSVIELLKKRGFCVRGIRWLLLFIFYLLVGAVFAIELGEKISIHGFASQGYMVSDTYNFQTTSSEGNGTYQFNEFGVNLNFDPTSDFRAGAQLLMREYGYIGDTKPTIDWAQIDYRFLDQLGIRLGRVKTPLGLYNESRDLDMARTTVFLPFSIYSEILRDAVKTLDGVQIYGYIPLHSLGGIEYKSLAGYTYIDPDNSGAIIAYTKKGFALDPQRSKSIREFSYSSSLSWLTPLDGLRFMFCISNFRTTSKQSDFSGLVNGSEFGQSPSIWLPYTAERVQSAFNKYNWYMFSAEYLIGDLELTAEGVYRSGIGEIDLTNIRIGPIGPAGLGIYVELPSRSERVEVTEYGGYLGANYRFSDWFQLGTFYDVRTSQVDEAENDSHDFALSARFDINEIGYLRSRGIISRGA